MTQVFRAPMRSRRLDVEPGAAVERALTLGMCGMGGVLSQTPATLTDAAAALSAEYDERWAARLQRFADVPDGALVWTRDIDGWLWLGQLAGPWRYDDRADAVAVDLVHVRPCRWLSEPVPLAEVPAGVTATFARGGKNWQGIHAEGSWAASSRLWERGRH